MDIQVLDAILATLVTMTIVALLSVKIFGLQKEKQFKPDPTMWGMYPKIKDSEKVQDRAEKELMLK